MSSVGTYLRGLRQRRGVSLEEIARTTRVAQRYLESLESDAFEALPSPVFTRGFIRAYCQALSEPPDEALAAYEARETSEPRGPQPMVPARHVSASSRAVESEPRGRGAVLVSFVLLVVLGIALFAVALVIHPRDRGERVTDVRPEPRPETRPVPPPSEPVPTASAPVVPRAVPPPASVPPAAPSATTSAPSPPRPTPGAPVAPASPGVPASSSAAAPVTTPPRAAPAAPGAPAASGASAPPTAATPPTTPPRPAPATPGTSTAPGAAAPSTAAAPATTPPRQAPATPGAATGPGASAPPSATAPASPAAPPIAVVAPSAVAPVLEALAGSISSPYRLVARTNDTTWIRVRTEDGRMSEENVPPGEVREWISNRPFTLTIGNAGGVSFELNGRTLPPLGPKGAVIQRIVLPPESR
jgi:cytoskeletal protein RodZ